MEFRNPNRDFIPIQQISLQFKIKGFHRNYSLTLNLAKLLTSEQGWWYRTLTNLAKWVECLSQSSQSSRTTTPSGNTNIFHVGCGRMSSWPHIPPSCLQLCLSAAPSHKSISSDFVPGLPNHSNFLPMSSYFHFHPSGLSLGKTPALLNNNNNKVPKHFFLMMENYFPLVRLKAFCCITQTNH